MGKIRSDCNNRVLGCEVRTHRVVLFLAYATCDLLDWTRRFFAILHYLHCRQRISHLCSFLVLQIAICSFYQSPVNNYKKKKSPLLEFHHFGIDKLKRLPKKSRTWRKLIRTDVCMPLIASYAYDILTSPLKEEKEWSGVKD